MALANNILRVMFITIQHKETKLIQNLFKIYYRDHVHNVYNYFILNRTNYLFRANYSKFYQLPILYDDNLILLIFKVFDMKFIFDNIPIFFLSRQMNIKLFFENI